MTITLTSEEIQRYAPYHTLTSFKLGYDEYRQGIWHGNRGDEHTLNGRAYDLGMECAMQRQRIGRIEALKAKADQIEAERNAPSAFEAFWAGSATASVAHHYRRGAVRTVNPGRIEFKSAGAVRQR